MDSLAVRDLGVRHAAIGFEAGGLSTKQGATLLLGLLDVLNESHCLLLGCPEPRCLLWIDLRSGCYQRLILFYHEIRRQGEKVGNRQAQKRGPSPQVEYLCLEFDVFIDGYPSFIASVELRLQANGTFDNLFGQAE